MGIKPEPPTRPGGHYTIKSLRLDTKSADAGKTWLLLPEGYRAQECGATYPLPARRRELHKLIGIYFPPNEKKRDAGCIYLRRAHKKYKTLRHRAVSAVKDAEQRQWQVTKATEHFKEKMKALRSDAKMAIEEVREEAAKQIANLGDLFALGRQGLDGQMKAHLAGEVWPHAAGCRPGKCAKECRGEPIDAAAFRSCFRMVTQAVKGLGLPSDQRKPASDAVMQELADAIRSTQETLALAQATETDPPKDAN